MPSPTPFSVAVIGGGPAGLMAAEVLLRGGAHVELFDAMPSVGRKFLLAGVGGLNLTHAEDKARFVQRYGARRDGVAHWLERFDADALRAWARELGIETFVGSSGRVFPTGMKAAPLLRAWLHRLRQQGAIIHTRHRWLGWSDATRRELHFATPTGEVRFSADAVVLALGGGSWPKLGSDGAWVPLLRQADIDVAPLQPANCGFEVAWSAHFRERFAGTPLKSVIASVVDADGKVLLDAAGHPCSRRGECVITATGIEGGLVYALSAPLRDAIGTQGCAWLRLDLAPDRSQEQIEQALRRPRGRNSLGNHLRKQIHLDGVKTGLLHEANNAQQTKDFVALSASIKALILRLSGVRPLDEAISCAGGVRLESLNPQSMLAALPGVFCAGEMLDWEAPTGGYLLTACFASGAIAGQGALAWCAARR